MSDEMRLIGRGYFKPQVFGWPRETRNTKLPFAGSWLPSFLFCMATAQMISRFKLTGICPPARGAVLAELLLTHAAPVWLVVASELRTAETLWRHTRSGRSSSGSPWWP